MSLEVNIDLGAELTPFEADDPKNYIRINTRRALKKIGNLYIKVMRDEQLSGRKADGTGLEARTGELRKRKNFKVDVTSDKTGASLTVTVGKGLKYTNLQEKGGKITAKNAKFLAIPLDDPLVRNNRGQQRYKSPRDVPGKLFVVESERGALFLARDDGRRGLKLLYILKKSVVIPARLGAKAVARGETSNFRKDAIKILEGLKTKIEKKFK